MDYSPPSGQGSPDPRPPYSGAQPPPLPHPYPPPPPPPPPRGPGAGLTILQSCLLSGCVTLLVPILLVFAFFGLMYAAIAPGISDAKSAIDSFGTRPSSNLLEKVIRPGAAGAGAIAIIKIHGSIDGEGSPLDGTGTMAEVTEELRNAAEDDAVKAILLQIDSPGGGLTASDQIYHEVRKAGDKGKKVVAWGGNAMASGAFYIAAGAEGIMVSPTCTVGSIGVIMQHFQVSDLMEKMGVKVDPITSGAHKDLGSPFRDMTPEEKEILQDFVDASYRRFVDIVAKGRNLPDEQVRKIADGTVFTADKALADGLIDKIGYIEDAIAWTEQLAGEKDMRVISYRRLPGLADLFREAGKGVSSALVETAAENPPPKAMAVWEEGR